MDHELRRSEILVSRSLVSRLSDAEVNAIMAISPTLSAALAGIPADVDLLDLGEDEPIPGVASLHTIVSLMCGITGVKLAKTMKVLHKKRPLLLPILDNVLQNHYWPHHRDAMRRATWCVYAADSIRMFHLDMISVEDELRRLRDWTVAHGTPLSHCRILDALIWAVRTGKSKFYRELGV
jgi:hypothetical protein